MNRLCHALLLMSISLHQSSTFAQFLPEKRISDLSSMPTYRQPDSISCGPTACAMVLQYYGIRAGIGPLKTAAGTRKFGNWLGYTHPEGIENAMEHYGLKTSIRTGCSISDLKRIVHQDRPAIVLLRSGRVSWHYVVVVGYRFSRVNQILIHDPSGQKRWIAEDDFANSWQFSHDMRGNYIHDPKCKACRGDGNLFKGKCNVCSGTGKWSAGPFGWTKCGTCGGQGQFSMPCSGCGGDGRLTDVMRKAVETSGAVGRTMIIPKLTRNGFKDSTAVTMHSVAIRNETQHTIRIAVTTEIQGRRITELSPRQTKTVHSRNGTFEIEYDQDATHRLRMTRLRLNPNTLNIIRQKDGVIRCLTGSHSR